MCVSESILSQFFLIIKIHFFIKLKVIKYKSLTKIKYLIFILKFIGKSHFIKSFLMIKKISITFKPIDILVKH